MFPESDEVGIRVVNLVIRNALGEIIATLSEKVQKPPSVVTLEMMATRRVAKLVQEVGLRQSHFEGDSKVGIKVLQDGNMLFSSFGLLVRDTLSFVSPL